MLPHSEIVPAAEALLANIPWLHPGTYSPSPLKDIQSYNNRSLRIDHQGSAYLLRLASENAHWLAIDRVEEIIAAKAAAALGLAPEVLYSDTDGNLLTRYINGQHWTKEAAKRPENIRRAAEALRRLHTIPKSPRSITMADRIDCMVNSASVMQLELPQDVDDLLAELRRRETQSQNEARFWSGLCHNDFWLNNFLDDGTHLWLLDWEFAGYGNGLYDLATFCLAANCDESQKVILLEAYGASEKDLPSLESAYFEVYFFEAIWSLLQHGLRGSEQEMNYQWYAGWRFGMLKELMPKRG